MRKLILVVALLFGGILLQGQSDKTLSESPANAHSGGFRKQLVSGDSTSLNSGSPKEMSIIKEPELLNETQTILINQGWSGISSYLDPADPSVVQMMAAIESKLIILKDFEGNVYQPANQNTIINWDFTKGYFIKMTSSESLEIVGLEPLLNQIDLQQGWNMIPVLSEDNVDIEEYFYDNTDKIEIVTEVAGLKIFWPEKEIATLQQLTPGKAYLIKAKESFSLFKLPTITTAPVIEIGATTATSGGNVTETGSSPVLVRGVVWNTTGLPTVYDNEGISDDGAGVGEFVSLLTGLISGNNYFVRAYATNSVGTAYGDELNFTTTTGFTCGVSNITDINGNNYNTVVIGNQCWTATNLRVTKYKDGTNIPTGLSDVEWANTMNTFEGAYAIFDYNHPDAVGIESEAEMIATYGNLYNWFAVDDQRGICPEGWHVPTDEEWTELTNFIGGTNIANKLKSCRQVGSPLGGACATSEHPRWNSNATHYGTDNFNLSSTPGGQRNENGLYSFIGNRGTFWSATMRSATFSWHRQLTQNSGAVTRGSLAKATGYSIRCVKNATVAPTFYSLNLSVAPVDGGTVTGGGDYEEGDQIIINATPNEGYDFVNWTDALGAVLSINASFEFTMPAQDITLTANFEEEIIVPEYYMLTLVADPIAGGVVEGGGEYLAGQQITLTATPNEGYVFVNWTDALGAVLSINASFEFTMPAQDITLTANFEEENTGTGTVTDIDGNVYQTIVFGGQEWMAENLRTTRYKNGTIIPSRLTNNQWTNTTQGAFAIYDHTLPEAAGIDSEDDMKLKYGIRYNFFAVIDSRGLCPEGWHVPSDAEWAQLTSYLITTYIEITETNVGNKIRSCRQVSSPLGGECSTSDHPRWNSHSTVYGTDDFDFTALPSGIRLEAGGYYALGLYETWWSATPTSGTLSSWCRTIFRHWGGVDRTFNMKNAGVSVRCVKNN